MPDLDSEKLSLLQWAAVAGVGLGGTLLGLFGFGSKRKKEDSDGDDDHIELYFLRAMRKIEEGQREERRLLYERLEKIERDLDTRLRAVEWTARLLDNRVSGLEVRRDQ